MSYSSDYSVRVDNLDEVTDLLAQILAELRKLNERKPDPAQDWPGQKT